MKREPTCSMCQDTRVFSDGAPCSVCADLPDLRKRGLTGKEFDVWAQRNGVNRAKTSFAMGTRARLERSKTDDMIRDAERDRTDPRR